jgi:hypothetical protein
LPVALEHLRRLLGRGLRATGPLWPAIGKASYEWVHRAAHILANHEEQSGAAVRRAYEDLLQEMAHRKDTLGPLAPAIDQFRKVTASYAAGLFHCYDIPSLPGTNNDLEGVSAPPATMSEALPDVGARLRE